MQKTKKKIGKKQKKIFLATLIIFLVILAFALILQFQGNDFFKDFFKEPEKIAIKDECSLILNNLIHKIKNEGECKISCRNICDIKGKEIYNFEFVENLDSCHSCDCFCK